MLNIKNTIWIIIFLFVLIVIPFSSYGQSSQQTLNQYISELQKNPNDNALREKIIKHVQTMKQKPAVPGEVVRLEGAAEYAFKSAKNESDYLDAAKEYEKALLVAPWLARDYFNCGVAYEKAGSYKEAISKFNLYLVAEPNAKDADTVLKRIGGLEYAGKKVAKESRPAAIAENKQTAYDEWLKKLDGVRYVTRVGGKGEGNVIYDATIDIRGNKVLRGAILIKCLDRNCEENSLGQYGKWIQVDVSTLNGREFSFELPFFSGGELKHRIVTGRISEDGNSVTFDSEIYRRER